MTDPHWIEYVKAFGPALIAIFVAYIAYQQWQINRASLREKLFERRFAIFQQTQEFLLAIAREGTAEDKALGAFHDAPRISRFLFDQKITDYLNDIKKNAMKQRRHKMRAQGEKDTTKRDIALDREEEALNWLADQLTVIYDKFEPYLGFGSHR